LLSKLQGCEKSPEVRVDDSSSAALAHFMSACEVSAQGWLIYMNNHPRQGLALKGGQKEQVSGRPPVCRGNMRLN
jgi:hypothetical protein